MSKTILEIAISVDGYVAGLHDEYDWLGEFDNPNEYGFDAFIPTIGAIVVGMRSYEIGVQQGWFKNQTYGPSPIFVVCKEQPANISADADFRFVTEGIEAVCHKAKAAANGKDVYVFGGPSIIQQFLEADLLDEMHIAFVPVILGQGIPLFANMRERRTKLERLDVKVFSKGLTSIYYKIIK